MHHSVSMQQRWAWIISAWSCIITGCLCGMNWLWVLLSSAAACAMLLWIQRAMPSIGVAAQIRLRWGKAGRIVNGVFFLWLVVMMSWTAGLSNRAFPMVSGFPELGWVLLGLAAWGICKGVEACARCCGVLCLLLIGLYGLVLVSALPDIQWEFMMPKGTVKQIVWCLGLALLPAAIWLLPKQKKEEYTPWTMIILFPLSAGVFSLITAGVLSPELAAEERVPFYNLTQSISVFGVVERMESLLSAAMIMGVFSLLSMLASACQVIADQIFSWKWSGAVACALALFIMPAAKEMPAAVFAAGNGLMWVVQLLAVWKGGGKSHAGCAVDG